MQTKSTANALKEARSARQTQRSRLLSASRRRKKLRGEIASKNSSETMPSVHEEEAQVRASCLKPALTTCKQPASRQATPLASPVRPRGRRKGRTTRKGPRWPHTGVRCLKAAAKGKVLRHKKPLCNRDVLCGRVVFISLNLATERRFTLIEGQKKEKKVN